MGDMDESKKREPHGALPLHECQGAGSHTSQLTVSLGQAVLAGIIQHGVGRDIGRTGGLVCGGGRDGVV